MSTTSSQADAARATRCLPERIPRRLSDPRPPPWREQSWTPTRSRRARPRGPAGGSGTPGASTPPRTGSLRPPWRGGRGFAPDSGLPQEMSREERIGANTHKNNNIENTRKYSNSRKRRERGNPGNFKSSLISSRSFCVPLLGPFNVQRANG